MLWRRDGIVVGDRKESLIYPFGGRSIHTPKTNEALSHHKILFMRLFGFGGGGSRNNGSRVYVQQRRDDWIGNLAKAKMSDQI